MKKSDLGPHLIGKKCVVYHYLLGRVVTTIEFIDCDAIGFLLKGVPFFDHYKNVRLVEKKKPKYYWLNEYDLRFAHDRRCRFVEKDPESPESHIKVKVTE